MKVKYVGPSLTGVNLPLPDGRILEIPFEEDTPDLPAEFVAGLLEQEANWAPADKPAAALLKKVQKAAAAAEDDTTDETSEEEPADEASSDVVGESATTEEG